MTSLVFASAYANPVSIPEAAPFVAHMERMSSGRLRLVSVYGWTNPHDRDEERTVLEDLTNGVADLACVGARAVGAALGIRSLEPLHAPLLFRDEQDVHQFVLSGRAEPLLAPLQEAGLVALALLPAGMRRPFGLTGPLVGPDDWKGKVIRTHASLTGEAALRALGATPVLRSSAELRAGPPVGIDGMDLDFQALAAWRYPGWLTCNVPLWPRLLLLVASQRRLARLSSADRSVLREATRAALAKSVDTNPWQRGNTLSDSVRLVRASEEDLALLRHRFLSVYDGLRTTPEGDMVIHSLTHKAR